MTSINPVAKIDTLPLIYALEGTVGAISASKGEARFGAPLSPQVRIGSLSESPKATESVGYPHRGGPPFRELNPRARLVMNWHVEVMAGKLAAVCEGRICRLMVCAPPRHLKSHLASVCLPAWCLGHDPSAQILCASYARDLADKLACDCRRIVASDRYQKLFPATRLSPQRPAVPEFETTAQGCRIATSVGGVLTGRGADMIIIDDPLKPEAALSQASAKPPTSGTTTRFTAGSTTSPRRRSR